MKKNKKSINYGKWGYLFILPFFIIYLIFSLIPLVDTVRYSFFEYFRSGIIFEASDLDGCNSIQRFYYITLPLIRPILAYTLITSIIGGLQMFDVPQILTNGQGNPDRTSMTLIMFLNSHLKSKNYGMAGALSVYLFIISGILCFIVYRMTNDNDPDGSKKAAKKRAKEERRRLRR